MRCMANYQNSRCQCTCIIDLFRFSMNQTILPEIIKLDFIQNSNSETLIRLKNVEHKN
jgi:hypothetical protein